MEKNEINFYNFLKKYCNYDFFSFNEYLAELEKKDGELYTENGLHSYELSQFESKTKRPELFYYETKTNENGEKIFIF